MTIVNRSTAELGGMVEAFYRQEACVLQAGDLEAWLSFLSKDIHYRVYHTMSVGPNERESGSESQSLYYDDNLESLRLRVRKFGSNAAWSESPKSRRRYFWQTLSVGVVDGECIGAISNVLVSYIRGDCQQNEFIGCRDDLFMPGDDGLKLVKRQLELDRALVTDRFINTIF